MRSWGRVQCVAMLDYKAGDAILAVRCQKDGRHGHTKSRQGYLYHRWDGHLPGGEHIKLRWDGIGVMPADWKPPERKKGADTWNGP